MDRLRRWIVIGVAVALAAFVTGYLRGASGTSPFEVESGAPGLLESTPHT